MSLQIVDASRWQGELPVDRLEVAGIAGVIVKATHGAARDPDVEFKRSWERLCRSSLERSAYGWFTGADPKLQAEAMVRVVERVQDATLPFGVDVEETNIPYRGEELLDRLRVMLARLKQLTGMSKLLVYSGTWYWDKFVGDAFADDIVEENYYWHSEYPRLELRDRRACGLLPPKLPKPHLPGPWRKLGVNATLWQWDGDGGCVLPNGVDADFNVFEGTREELCALLPPFVVGTLPPPGPIEYISPTVRLAGDFVKELADDGDRRS